MPRYTYRGGRGVRATYRRRLARPTVGVVPALLFFSYISQGPGNRNHTFQPLSICSGSARFSKYASRIPSPEISGGRGVAGVRGPSVGQPFLLTFIYFPAQGNALSRQVTADRARSLCVFFCCTVSDGPGCPPFGGMAVVETDRDFAEDSPSPYSPPDHPKPYDIFLIGNGRLRGYGYRRTPRRKGSR